jgi:DNA (cytosine-5)-methyltransferase 1
VRTSDSVSARPTHLDFFAGSGLVSTGLEPYFRLVWANDNSEQKAAVFTANHPESRFILANIETIDGRAVPAATLSWGSFPCQDLSLAGKLGGLKSHRSGLVWHWLRVMDEMPIRPPVVVAENVIGLVSADEGNHYRALHTALTERGYRVGAVVIDASHWVPQSRKRVFIVGVDSGSRTTGLEAESPNWGHPAPLVKAARGLPAWIWWRLPMPPARGQSLREVIDTGAPVDHPDRTGYLLSLVPPRHLNILNALPSRGILAVPGYRRIRNGKQVLELRFDGLAGCLRTPSGGSSRQVVVLKENKRFTTRLLTVAETAALMGAPPGYSIPGSYNDGYAAMGDAVALPVVRFLAQHLLAPLADRVQHGRSTVYEHQEEALSVCERPRDARKGRSLRRFGGHAHREDGRPASKTRVPQDRRARASKGTRP